MSTPVISLANGIVTLITTHLRRLSGSVGPASWKTARIAQQIEFDRNQLVFDNTARGNNVSETMIILLSYLQFSGQ